MTESGVIVIVISYNGKKTRYAYNADYQADEAIAEFLNTHVKTRAEAIEELLDKSLTCQFKVNGKLCKITKIKIATNKKLVLPN